MARLSLAFLQLAVGTGATDEVFNVTFANELTDGNCSLFWHGFGHGLHGPRAVLGPLAAGGFEVMEVSEGHHFSFAFVGTLQLLKEIVVQRQITRYALQEVDLQGDNTSPEECAASVACRAAGSCSECIKLNGCGWSPVREKCFPAHPIASDSETCGNTDQRSPEEWVKHAKELMDVKQPDFGPAKLRAAYRALKNALSDSSASDEIKDSIAALLSRITPKLEAVFDDEDAKLLLEASRHHGLASVHGEIPRVPRRKFLEAKEMIMRDEPVVITDLFEALDLAAKPVSHKWTLDYLNLRMHQGFYNIAADIPGRCCQYYEPRKVAAEAKYPYPFRPTTHLYRDSFDGFAKTLHSGKTKGGGHLVHYFHDVVMERDGSLVVAGQAAPKELAADLRAVAKALRPAQRLQPFFGGIANAKLWIGQKGVVMPLHYDSADNLYVMAWGRKRVLLADPGQQDAFYPHPSGHPNAGSAQVKLSAPNLTRFPGFASAKLRETVVGPGDVLFLPNHWWHQFEQPFEQTASLNVWSYEAPDTPPVSLRDKRMRGIAIQNFMEAKMVELFKNKAGVLLKVLADPAKRASKKGAQEKLLQKANASLFETAENGRRWVDRTFGTSGVLESSARLVERCALDGEVFGAAPVFATLVGVEAGPRVGHVRLGSPGRSPRGPLPACGTHGHLCQRLLH